MMTKLSSEGKAIAAYMIKDIGGIKYFFEKAMKNLNYSEISDEMDDVIEVVCNILDNTDIAPCFNN